MLVFFVRRLASISLLASLVVASSCYADEGHPLAVVVSSKPELAIINQLAARELNLIYWKKKQYWQDGVHIHPVNLHAEHPYRLSFSKVVLGSEPAEQNNYWNGLYFHGITPPYSVQSEEAVIRYVASTKGAVGYVDACKVDERVRTVLWINNEKISATPPERLNCSSAQ